MIFDCKLIKGDLIKAIVSIGTFFYICVHSNSFLIDLLQRDGSLRGSWRNRLRKMTSIGSVFSSPKVGKQLKVKIFSLA